jgi:hypothetical protein
MRALPGTLLWVALLLSLQLPSLALLKFSITGRTSRSDAGAAACSIPLVVEAAQFAEGTLFSNAIYHDTCVPTTR